MKAFSAAACSLFFAAGLIQTAVGLKCGSGCAACWKDGSPGVDTKFSCPDGYHCGDNCPKGYSDLHCAKGTRCKCSHGLRSWNCDDLGPCACGLKNDGHECEVNLCF